MITTDLMKISSNCGDSSCVGIPDVSTGSCSNESECSSSDCILSPGGNEYFLPSSVESFNIPFVGQEFESLSKGYKFYKDCEGFNDFKVGKTDGKQVKERRTVSRRCGCKAKMVLKFMSPNKYFVFSFAEKHNHDLASETGRQFFRVNRAMTISLRNIVYDGAKVNIGCRKMFCFAKEQFGGYSNMMIDKFKVILESSEGFYYAYEADSVGQLTKMFWTDAIGWRNFEIYGDAVSFDATFDTNKYSMIFTPFTGVDKHDRCVTFASCLLSQESVSIPNAFSDVNGLIASKHRLCMWHIMQKFPLKLCNRLCKDTDFMKKMKKYIWSSVIEIDEFERGWEAVIKEFKLKSNKWLQDLYALRCSWIPVYFRDEPMFGLMRTTSRSESENFFFGQFHKQGDTLCEFWLRFQSAIDRQRNETARLDHESKSTIPTTLSKWFIEDDAADLFTRAIFYKVQEEILASFFEMQIKRMTDEIDGVTHMEIKDVRVKDKLFKVYVSRNHVVCSCKKFVMCGIVCRHAFCGLKQIGVTKLPRSLVLNRWMKIADSGT
ncbi:hypothetical protein POM88_044456 [Heracleum sosnowskyi]|uniref:SWIM-type domain-containing protein n=1 Tax=Heracleum sosnowskyi TaxID=360622 RepID=A0AAD8H5G6_9APIA|nr:hypothetical protein POM88_044456 [Heracleum sosnowskyi]